MKIQIDSGLVLSRHGGIARISSDSGFFAERYVKSFNLRRAPHYHDFNEIELVESGHGFCNVNGQRFELSRGDLFFIRTTDVHGYEIAKGESLTVRTVRFSGELDGSMFTELNAHDILAAKLPEAETKRLIKLTDECMSELKAPDRYSPIICAGIVNRICASLLRHLEASPEVAIASPLAASATMIIKSEYTRSLGVTSIAERLGVSPNHLGRSFKAAMGISLNAYLLRVRLGAATSRLMHTGLSVKQIAIECGFGSPSAFSREFTRQYGIPPSEFRGSSPSHGKK